MRKKNKKRSKSRRNVRERERERERERARESICTQSYNSRSYKTEQTLKKERLKRTKGKK